MADTSNPVTGRMYVESTTCLVMVDVSALVEHNTHDVLELLMGEPFFEQFMEIACVEPAGSHDGHAPEGLAFEGLLAELVARLSTRQALTGRQALRVGHEMVAHAEQIVGAERAAAAALQIAATQPVREAS